MQHFTTHSCRKALQLPLVESSCLPSLPFIRLKHFPPVCVCEGELKSAVRMRCRTITAANWYSCLCGQKSRCLRLHDKWTLVSARPSAPKPPPLPSHCLSHGSLLCKVWQACGRCKCCFKFFTLSCTCSASFAQHCVGRGMERGSEGWLGVAP